jgi:hypothetical protein
MVMGSLWLWQAVRNIKDIYIQAQNQTWIEAEISNTEIKKDKLTTFGAQPFNFKHCTSYKRQSYIHK